MLNTTKTDLQVHSATVSVPQLKTFLELSMKLMGKQNGEWPWVYVRAEGEHKLIWVCGKSTKSLQFTMEIPEVLQNFPKAAFKSEPLLGVLNCFKDMTMFSMLYDSYMVAVSLYAVDELELAGKKWPKMPKVPLQKKAWELPQGFGRGISSLLSAQEHCKDRQCPSRKYCSNLSISCLGFASVSCQGTALAPFQMDEDIETIIIPGYADFFRAIQNEKGSIRTWRREERNYLCIEAGPWSLTAKIPAVKFPDLQQAWMCLPMRDYYIQFTSADVERLCTALNPMYFPRQAGSFRMAGANYGLRLDIQLEGQRFGVSPQFRIWEDFVADMTVKKLYWLLSHGFTTLFFKPGSLRCGAWNGTVMLFTGLK